MGDCEVEDIEQRPRNYNAARVVPNSHVQHRSRESTIMTKSAKASESSPVSTSPKANNQTTMRADSPSPRQVVAVTGAASPLGEKVIQRLVGLAAVAKVIAIDSARGGAGESPAAVDQAARESSDHDGPAAPVVWRVADIRDPALVRRLSHVDVVVHSAVDFNVDTDAVARTETLVGATRTVVTAAAAAGVRRLVLITSAMVYGASVDNPLAIDEDAPLGAIPEGLLADLLEVERIAQISRAAHPGLSITVVRPAALVGPGIDTMVTRHFAAPRLLTIRDAAPRWQFCHVDDLASAICRVVTMPISIDVRTESGERSETPAPHAKSSRRQRSVKPSGFPQVVNVGCDGWLEQGEVETLTDLRRIELPTGLVFAAAARLHRAGVTPAPASELTYLLHPWVVSATWLREVGWAPAYDNASVLSELLEMQRGEHAVVGRRFGRRDATVAGASAAGATVALIGAAAIVRRARRTRGF